ncbi:hypothetical protein AcW1_006064 [Taiwanofungus camphoratus]|nr:hypothetical protein AcW2_004826 [Antrodia cinnamomea]KAI0950124.1 hypothetical protein AcV7_008685 [Antrodia cinnamomea]KAI0957785.1 hypothetical protein AcW1_006064 [Antrodia cinnamomea]KAI0957786.1 hypothetical protein AcW1_006064 [Antrodia cinnamomea]
MSGLRVVHFKDPIDFLNAMEPYDDNSMNFALGSLLDNMDETQRLSQAHWGSQTRTLLAVFRGDELLLTLTKNAMDFSWMMSVPTVIEHSREANDITAAVHLLATFLSTIIHPSAVDKVIGPEEAVNTFIETWVTFMATRGIHLKALDPYFRSRGCYATRATLPEPSSAFDSHQISLASGSDDVTSLVPLYIEFSSHGPVPATLESAQNIMREAVEAQKVWLCRSDGEVAGYVLVGRTTSRTTAIRNVFVVSQHRRKGIAEAMVRAVTRYYLGAEPLGFKGAPTERPLGGTKDEICLNVADPGAERIYKRCGFMLDEHARDPITGRKRWYQSIWRGVVPL